MEDTRDAYVILKLSKYCNLRCTYCYEFNELDRRARMPLDGLRALFASIARSREFGRFRTIRFVFHGGEPLLLPLNYLEAIRDIQAEVFGPATVVRNELQSNLTVLTDEHVAFLKSGFVGAVGVSFDIASDERRSKAGRNTAEVTLRNMARLIDAGVTLGAISVLTRRNIDTFGNAFAFFDAVGVDYKILPFYRHANASQIDVHGLGGGQIADAMIRTFDLWSASGRRITVHPLDELLSYALYFLAGDALFTFSKAEERVLIVNTNGDTWGHEGLYDPADRYGNLFSDSYDSIIASSARAGDVARAEARRDRLCGPCAFHGFCPGHFVQNATLDQQREIEREGCWAARVMRHICDRLEGGIDGRQVPVELAAIPA